MYRNQVIFQHIEKKIDCLEQSYKQFDSTILATVISKEHNLLGTQDLLSHQKQLQKNSSLLL